MNVLQEIDIGSLLIAALTFTVAGVVGFWCKDVPLRVGKFIMRQCTTGLSLTSSHSVYYELIRYIQAKYKTKNFRKFKLINGKWGEDDKALLSIGYGGHVIRYKKYWLHINVQQRDSQGTMYDKEIITVTKLGRKRSAFEKLFADISVNPESDKYVGMKIAHNSGTDAWWVAAENVYKRKMDTIFLANSKKQTLLNTMQTFIDSEDWYISNGIPYHLGIMLYGHPGTGKTSLVRAIASHFNYPIYALNVGALSKLSELKRTMPEKSILLIEDLDCEKQLQHRDPEPNSGDSNPGGPVLQLGTLVNFSDVLNAIDGISPSHGCILIATTNHIEKLDPALIRPGRIDLLLEIDYIDLEALTQFTQRFYNQTPPHDIVIRSGITCADLQLLVLQQRTYENVLEYVTKGDDNGHDV